MESKNDLPGSRDGCWTLIFFLMPYMKESLILKQSKKSIENPCKINCAELISIVLWLNSICFSLSPATGVVCFSLLSSRCLLVSSAEVLAELKWRGSNQEWGGWAARMCFRSAPGLLSNEVNQQRKWTGILLIVWLMFSGTGQFFYSGTPSSAHSFCCINRSHCTELQGWVFDKSTLKRVAFDFQAPGAENIHIPWAFPNCFCHHLVDRAATPKRR